MEQAYLDIIKATGEDPDRPGLVDTPKRAAQAMMFLTQGYKMDIDEVINDAMFPSDTDEIIIVKNIALIPEAVARAAVPPSSAQTLSSKTWTVGLDIRL